MCCQFRYGNQLIYTYRTHVIMDSMALHLGWIFEAFAIIAGIFYLYHRRLRHRMLKVRCADMLLVELRNIGANVDLVKGNYVPDQDSYYDLPHAVYDGLITSTNMSYFDTAIQRTLHSLYTNIHRYNMVAPQSRETPKYAQTKPVNVRINRPMAESNLEGLIKKLDTSVEIVQKFHDKHKPEGRGRAIASMFGLLDKE